MSSSAPHPSFLVRPLLAEFDNFISDRKLEALYNIFKSATITPPEVAFSIVFPALRAPYLELCNQMQLENRDLVRTIELHSAEINRLNQAHAAEIARNNQLHESVASDLIRQLEAQTALINFKDDTHARELQIKDDTHARELQMKDDFHARQLALHEAQVVEYRAGQADALAKERESTLVFQNHLLHAPSLQTPKLGGSVTRAATWILAKNTHAHSKRMLPTNPVIVENMRKLLEPSVKQLLEKGYRNETPLYTSFLAILKCALTDNATYHNTSRNPYLGGLEPDLTLSSPGVLEPDGSSVLVLFEMKKRATNLGSDKALGQLFDYLVLVTQEQVGRRFFTGVLSNVSRNLVLTLEVTSVGVALVEYNVSSIYETIAFLYETSLALDSHRPPTLGFSAHLGPMQKRLGNTRQAVVGQFTPPGNRGLVMAVKRVVRDASAAAEIALLTGFKMDGTRPRCIPHLMYEAVDKSEFGITPVGKPLVPGTFSNPGQIRVVVIDVHSALSWLHDRGIVHRDVRCDNVIVDKEGRGVLIDFDAACQFRRGSLRIWRGGYLCCPPRLIRDVHRHGWLKTYAPSEADDWHAFILLVNCLVFPTTFVGFQSHLVGNPGTEEARMFLALWSAMENSVVWSPFVKAATVIDRVVLKSIAQAFVFL